MSTETADPTASSPAPTRNIGPMQAARRRNLDLDLYRRHIAVLAEVMPRLGWRITLVPVQENVDHPDTMLAELDEERRRRDDLEERRALHRRRRASRRARLNN
jgi:hypothetical protein